MLYLGTLVALVVAALLAMALRASARKIGLIDSPDHRKDHAQATPTTGGVAMFLAFFTGLTLGGAEVPGLVYIFSGGLVLVILGVLDDIRHIDFRFRFAAQAGAAAFLVFGADVRVESLGNLLGFGEIPLGMFSAPFTIFAIVGLINAVNMLDGMDGLAGGAAAVSLAGIFAVSLSAVPALSGPVLVLIGSVVGFLLVNVRFPWRRAAPVFMGDAGSTFLGYCLAWFVISLPQNGSAVISPIAALWLVGLPVADTLATILRRRRQGLSAFDPGHNHIHHLLRDAGFGTNGTVVTVCCIAAVFTGVGLYQVSFRTPPEAVLSFSFVVAVLGTYKLMQYAVPLAKPLRRLLEVKS